MVTNIPMHVGVACMFRSFISNEDSFPGLKKRCETSDSHTARRTNDDARDRRACNLLASTLISIAIFEKSGVALGY